MAKKNFRVDVIQTYEVELDEDKLTEDFWKEFAYVISAGTEGDLEYLAEHVAWNYCIGERGFVEGIGLLDEMNIKILEVSSDVEITDKW